MLILDLTKMVILSNLGQCKIFILSIFYFYLSCFEFASKFDTATGTNFDPENPLFDRADNLDSKSRTCPSFANWGCFTTNYTKGDYDFFGDSSFNKGCSMFERTDESTACYDFVDHELYGRWCKRQTSTLMGNPGGMEEPLQCDMFSLECAFTTKLILDSSCFAEKSFSKSDDLFIQISSRWILINCIICWFQQK